MKLFAILFFAGFAYLYIRQMDRTQEIVPQGIFQTVFLTLSSCGVVFNICMLIYVATL